MTKKRISWGLLLLALGLFITLTYLEDQYQSKKNRGWETLPFYAERFIAFDPQGRAWFPSQKGINILDGEELTFYNKREIDAWEMFDIAFHPSGDVWIAEQSGLLRYRNGKWKKFTSKNSDIEDDSIHTLAIDLKGRIWLGYYKSGLGLIDDGDINLYTPDSFNVHEIRITALVVDDDGNLWMGTEENSIFIFDGETWLSLNKYNNGPYLKYINVIEKDPQGRIWIYGDTEKVSFFVIYDHGVWSIEAIMSWSMPILDPHRWDFDNQGRPWMVYNSLYIQDEGNWKDFYYTNSGTPRDSYSVAFDPYGRAWIQSYRGPLKIAPDLETLEENKIPENMIEIREKTFFPPMMIFWVCVPLTLWFALILDAILEVSPGVILSLFYFINDPIKEILLPVSLKTFANNSQFYIVLSLIIGGFASRIFTQIKPISKGKRIIVSVGFYLAFLLISTLLDLLYC